MSSCLSSTKLPSKKEMIALFFHYKLLTKLTIRESSHATARDVMLIWEKARIPVRQKKHVVDKIEGAFREWEKLKKNKENKKKRSEALKGKEDEWKLNLDQLFDIAHADALQMISIQEDKDFLLAQRECGRRGKMSGVDTSLVRREAETQRKQHVLQQRRAREEVQKLSREQLVKLASSDSDDESSTTLKRSREMQDSPAAVVESEEEQPTSSAPCRKRVRRGRLNIVNDKMAACLDMAKVSDRGAVLVLTPTIQHLGLDPSLYNLSHASIRRQRLKHRKDMAESLKAEFKTDLPLTVHWDGKLLEDINRRQTVDLLPVLMSGKGLEQLLAVPKMPSGTGEAAARAVHEAALAWGICNQIKCMSFDTTAANSGPRNGACILLEQKMQKDMLWLACRHHIFEIMLEAVVVLSLGVSQGPDLLLFKRFRTQWVSIDTMDYQTSLSDTNTANAVVNFADSIIHFCMNQLKQFQPRNDYNELLELSDIFLGGMPVKGITLKTPAGLHRARWMAKAIYALKVWMFRGQFKLTKAEEKGL